VNGIISGVSKNCYYIANSKRVRKQRKPRVDTTSEQSVYAGPQADESALTPEQGTVKVLPSVAAGRAGGEKRSHVGDDDKIENKKRRAEVDHVVDLESEEWEDKVFVRRVIKSSAVLSITLPAKSAGGTGVAGRGAERPQARTCDEYVDDANQRVCILYGDKYMPHKASSDRK
jgi:hypothetical protein